MKAYVPIVLGVALSWLAPCVVSVHADVPPGFELVELTTDHAHNRWPHLNDCGEIVYRTYTSPGFALLLYDNGAIRWLTPAHGKYYTPFVGDGGNVVWGEEIDGAEQIVLWKRGAEAVITDSPYDDQGPRLNDHGHIIWKRWYGDGCGSANAAVMFYDGVNVIEITDGTSSDQAIAMNDLDAIVWMRHDFCHDPWRSEIMLFTDGATTQLTFDVDYIERNPAISNRGDIYWGGNDGVVKWTAGLTQRVTGWGHYVDGVNESGDFVLNRWHDDLGTWQMWLYRNGVFYCISPDGTLWGTGGAINEYGECVWETGPALPLDVLFLRRIRNGDTDFDLDVDINDYAPWPGCLTGPVPRDRLCACRFLDMDHDRDVDLADVALFQQAMGTVVEIGTGDCCTPHYDPGCTNPDIMDCVCAEHPECCSETWDADCAAAAIQLGCADCP